MDFFENLLSKQGECRPKLEAESIDLQNASWLEGPFEEVKVLGVVRNMLNKDRASCPDGFSMGSFQVCWDVIKEDLMKVFQELFSTRELEKSLNAIFIALIPKIVGAIELKDFHYISLVTEVYKILFKVLANLLGKVVGSIISKSHNAFVKDRQIWIMFSLPMNA